MTEHRIYVPPARAAPWWFYGEMVPCPGSSREPIRLPPDSPAADVGDVASSTTADEVIAWTG
jgi:hypothetical protein